ncbi:hypothetical protein TNCV_3575951 [Trichonephila clavipes]|nr:hypothetical protein TNCV_3575951 [Trichonephila clavipes]
MKKAAVNHNTVDKWLKTPRVPVWLGCSLLSLIPGTNSHRQMPTSERKPGIKIILRGLLSTYIALHLKEMPAQGECI